MMTLRDRLRVIGLLSGDACYPPPASNPFVRLRLTCPVCQKEFREAYELARVRGPLVVGVVPDEKLRGARLSIVRFALLAHGCGEPFRRIEEGMICGACRARRERLLADARARVLRGFAAGPRPRSLWADLQTARQRVERVFWREASTERKGLVLVLGNDDVLRVVRDPSLAIGNDCQKCFYAVAASICRRAR